MWTFIGAGVLYLLGVAAVLYIKPSLMFTPDGQWKEFGIGQNEDRYSPFPFWLFCLTWAIVSYVIVLILTPLVTGVSIRRNNNTFNTTKNYNQRPKVNQAELDVDYAMNGDVNDSVELPKGYYVLNKKATRLAGVPKYVYIGAEEP
jgi:hypothetical protein